MKAAVYKPEYGSSYVAIVDEEVPIPHHNSKQALLKVEAAGIK